MYEPEGCVFTYTILSMYEQDWISYLDALDDPTELRKSVKEVIKDGMSVSDEPSTKRRHDVVCKKKSRKHNR